MSALAVPVLDHSPSRPRRHLHLVSASTPRVRAAARPRARLTVRGRRVLLGAAVVVALMGVLAVSSFASGAGASDSVTVQPGQTLSDIARTHLPELPTGAAVAHLQLANQLNSMQVSSGQRLVVPAP